VQAGRQGRRRIAVVRLRRIDLAVRLSGGDDDRQPDCVLHAFEGEWVMSRMLISTVVLMLALSVGLGMADDKGPNRGNNNRRESPQQKAREQAQRQREEAERLRRAAAELLKKEQAAFAAANQELLSAKAAQRADLKSLAEARGKATAELERSVGMARALEEMKSAQAEFDATAKPVLEALREQPEYKAAQEEADQAGNQLRSLKDDESLTEEARRARSAELFPRTLAASELEKKAVRANPAAAAAREKLEAAQKKVGELRDRISERIEKDAGVAAARVQVEKSLAGVDAAENRLAKLKAQAAAAEQRLQAGIVPKDRDDDRKKGDGKSDKK
jgi:DNA repair exonuclease SbcCD ATPase subunit